MLAKLDAQGIPYAFNEKALANQEACIEYLHFFNRIVKEKCSEAKAQMLLLAGGIHQISYGKARFCYDAVGRWSGECAYFRVAEG